MGISKEKIQLGSIEEIEFPRESFDYIAFRAVLEHVYDPAGAISKALKWLKPNGLISFDIPSSNWLTHKLINSIYKFQGTDYVANLSPMHVPFHLYEFDIKSFENYAEINNCTIAYHTTYVCETYLPKFLDHLLKPIMKWNDSGMQLEVWLRKNK